MKWNAVVFNFWTVSFLPSFLFFFLFVFCCVSQEDVDGSVRWRGFGYALLDTFS